ncbi:MAG TPA: amino acid adenylation domain-containing protein, partial [Thermoanaerobaculia bacterium]|nr:amino acid adenylation domain-containing protein [Thermoanaerobaculia bacterium]
ALGRPIAHTRAYLLDRAGLPVPLGVAGELCAAGDGLARGYLGRPDSTAQAFIPDPFGAPGGRLYRTGDLARHLPDGRLEFLGRLDQQVKLRGFRIEPGEIEAALLLHPRVREAAILVREDIPGDRRLVAYVAADGIEAGDLRQRLQQRLPDYMVPSAFVVLDALPLNQNGKVDRRALPAPARELPAAAAALRTPTEELLAAIFATVFGVEEVGLEESFFDLGGHSLLATRVISRVRETFGADLSLSVLFDRPTVAGLAAAMESEQSAGRLAAAPPLVPVEWDRPLPLSFAQERLWFLDRLQPGSAVYNMPAALRLDAGVDAAALARALGAVVSRHEALRTTFHLAADGPVQRIAEPPSAAGILARIDLAGLPVARRRDEALRLATAEAARPFDLAAGPLLRAALLHLGDGGALLLLTLHHIVADGWSMDLLADEVTAHYQAALSGGAAPMPELPIQYADFAVWQRQWLSGEELERQLAHWRERLAGAPTVLELPTDRPWLALPDSRGAERRRVLPAGLARDLRALGRAQGTTLFMTLLAAFGALLSRYSGQEDLVLGTPVAGRNRVEVEPLIGLFVNTLALRVDLSGSPSFRELAHRARETALAAYAHQDLPFEKLVEELRVERDLGRSPVFQAMLALPVTEHSADAADAAEVDETDWAAGTGTAKFELALEARETAAGLALEAEYRTDLFDGVTIERLLGHLELLLRQVVADPKRPLVDAALLAGAERHALLAEWNDTASPGTMPALCVQELFARRAALAPEATALVMAAKRLSYGELEGRANQLARHLRRLGVGPGVPVGVCLERSLEMGEAILGVLKAGGCYVPLDPAYPRERLAFMIEDAGLDVLLTQDALAGLLPGARRLLRVDADAHSWAGESDADPGVEVHPESLAYVIYTSGSAGRPKGVQVPHRALANHATAVAERYGLTPADRVLQFASLSFDVAAEELFPAWISGAALVPRPAGLFPSFQELEHLLSHQRITVANLPTPYWHEWVDDLARTGTAPPASLRLLVVGTEQAAPERLTAWRRLAGDHVRWINAYGPTEATITATLHEAGATAAAAPAARVPIGRPIARLQAHVLDAAFEPAPLGVVGELYLGGAGVARGYLHHPDRTAAVFLPDPFSGLAGARLYRTGDRARRFPSGELDFLGRADDQVKIRGFRIEPGEIEAALRRLPEVQDCCVVVREDAGERRLVAYAVPGAAAARGGSLIDALRASLAASLPSYMMPSAFVLLEALPLTPNGKVDRQALSAAAAPAAAAPPEVTAPRTPVEERLAGIFAAVLGVERVGVEESFFELGGHSLLATRVMSRVSEALGLDLPLRTLFEAPSVARLAAVVEAAGGASLQALPPLEPVRRDQPLPLSFAQERLWFLAQLEPESAAYNMPQALPLEAGLDPWLLERALADVARRHEALRTTFPPSSGQPVQRIAPPAAAWSLPRVDLAALPAVARAAEASRLAGLEAGRPFDLTAGPLLRTTLLQLGAPGQWLLFTLHHIIADGWSLDLLEEEVTALVQAFARGEASPLPELPVQYADFAVWQRRTLTEDRLA